MPAGGNWSSIFVAKLDGANDLQCCSATKVGPATLLTAAHCLDQGDNDQKKLKPLRKFSIKALPDSNDLLTFDCKLDPRYTNLPFRVLDPRGGADFALCRLISGGGPALQRFQGFPSERISLMPLSVGQAVLITGYGCTKMKVDLAGRMIDIPSFRESFNIGDETIHAAAGNVVKTLSERAREPALCKGDSGGPLFTGAMVSTPDAERTVRGVNSRVSAASGELVSTMASLASTEFLEFLGCWQTLTSAEVFIRGSVKPLPCVRRPVP